MLDDIQARIDYRLFWSRNPGVKNPSDINSQAKYEFAREIGWERLCNMQKARKAGRDYTKLDQNNVPRI